MQMSGNPIASRDVDAMAFPDMIARKGRDDKEWKKRRKKVQYEENTTRSSITVIVKINTAGIME